MSRANPNMPPFNGVAARVSHRSLAKHRGKFVTLVAIVKQCDTNLGILVAEDAVSNDTIQIQGVHEVEVAVNNEFFCFVDQSGGLHYHSHATLNDDFNFDNYRKLVQLIENQYPNLFF